ncbi:MAG: hypothetical protein WC755_04995 [Candidatus Woesearchaeota archaeon]
MIGKIGNVVKDGLKIIVPAVAIAGAGMMSGCSKDSNPAAPNTITVHDTLDNFPAANINVDSNTCKINDLSVSSKDSIDFLKASDSSLLSRFYTTDSFVKQVDTSLIFPLTIQNKGSLGMVVPANNTVIDSNMAPNGKYIITFNKHPVYTGDINDNWRNSFTKGNITISQIDSLSYQIKATDADTLRWNLDNTKEGMAVRTNSAKYILDTLSLKNLQNQTFDLEIVLKNKIFQFKDTLSLDNFAKLYFDTLQAANSQLFGLGKRDSTGKQLTPDTAIVQLDSTGKGIAQVYIVAPKSEQVAHRNGATGEYSLSDLSSLGRATISEIVGKGLNNMSMYLVKQLNPNGTPVNYQLVVVPKSDTVKGISFNAGKDTLETVLNSGLISFDSLFSNGGAPFVKVIPPQGNSYVLPTKGGKLGYSVSTKGHSLYGLVGQDVFAQNGNDTLWLNIFNNNNEIDSFTTLTKNITQGDIAKIIAHGRGKSFVGNANAPNGSVIPVNMVNGKDTVEFVLSDTGIYVPKGNDDNVLGDTIYVAKRKAVDSIGIVPSRNPDGKVYENDTLKFVPFGKDTSLSEVFRIGTNAYAFKVGDTAAVVMSDSGSYRIVHDDASSPMINVIYDSINKIVKEDTKNGNSKGLLDKIRASISDSLSQSAFSQSGVQYQPYTGGAIASNSGLIYRSREQPAGVTYNNRTVIVPQKSVTTTQADGQNAQISAYEAKVKPTNGIFNAETFSDFLSDLAITK